MNTTTTNSSEPTVSLPAVDYDNIAESETPEEDIAHFIGEMEKTPSVADLYMNHLRHSTVPVSRYLDEFDNVADDVFNVPNLIEYEDVLSNIGSTIGNVGKNNNKTMYNLVDNYQRDVSEYTPYPTHSPSCRTKFPMSEINDVEAIESAIDNISERVDIIYDCVKSTDQQINDLFEKSLGIGDIVEELQESVRSNVLRLVETNNRTIRIENIQSELMTRLELMEKTQGIMKSQLRDIIATLADIHKCVKTLRYNDSDDQ